MTFVSGVIATIEGDLGELSDFHDTREEDGHELNAHINYTRRNYNLEGDMIAHHGKAVEEKLVKEEAPDVDDEGTIRVMDKLVPSWEMTEFWIVRKDNPGNFIVVENSDGRFAFDLFAQATGTNVEQVRFNLEEIANDFPGQWVGGFEKRSGRVQSGLLYGDDIEDDTEMGDPYRKTRNKNIIGPKIDYRGQNLKVKIGADGWVQIVSPGTYPRDAYLSFLKDILLNYRRN